MDSEYMANPRCIVRLWILLSKNTRDLLHNISLPTIVGCTFCKCWHLGMSCFSQYTWVISHVHPLHVSVGTVLWTLTVERAAVTATAAAATVTSAHE